MSVKRAGWLGEALEEHGVKNNLWLSSLVKGGSLHLSMGARDGKLLEELSDLPSDLKGDWEDKVKLQYGAFLISVYGLLVTTTSEAIRKSHPKFTNDQVVEEMWKYPLLKPAKEHKFAFNDE